MGGRYGGGRRSGGGGGGYQVRSSSTDGSTEQQTIAEAMQSVVGGESAGPSGTDNSSTGDGRAASGGSGTGRSGSVDHSLAEWAADQLTERVRSGVEEADERIDE